jgi:glucose-6-phosphate 1-dehydrogenase
VGPPKSKSKDLTSAKKLATDLGALYKEENLLRMDHFLGYEICQNILSVRFGNAFLEPLMNRNHVAAVRVTLKEDFGTEGRGGYFTHYGIIRDVIQNHLLQMVTLVAMEKPCNVGGDIRDAKVAVLKAMLDADPEEALFPIGCGMSLWDKSSTWVVKRVGICDADIWHCTKTLRV